MKDKPIEEVRDGTTLIAIIVRSNYKDDGITFFTPDDFSQQLAYIHHDKGKSIQPHVHNLVDRQVSYTQEVLIVKSGKIKVDLYTQEQEFLMDKILLEGDIILLATGGHGFEMMEESEIYEVKQGPYAGDQDKVRF